MLSLLENGLFALGQILRFPVMALLWVCVLATLIMVGTFLMDALARRRERSGFNVETWLRGGPVLEVPDQRIQQLPAYVRSFLTDIHRVQKDQLLDGGGLENLLLQTEETIRQSLSSSRLLTKVGPSLGLLGTLIPMGASLAAMATGNLEAMAGQMVVAFTTTIVGIACGTVAFVVNTHRQHWVHEIVREQRYIAERVLTEIDEGEF